MATIAERRTRILKALENPRAVERALEVVYANQTADEQGTGETVELNGVGFSKNDAAFGESLVMGLRKYGSLTQRQIAAGRKMISRYWRQLAAAADAKSPGWDGSKPAPREEPVDGDGGFESADAYEIACENEAARRYEEMAYGR